MISKLFHDSSYRLVVQFEIPCGTLPRSLSPQSVVIGVYGPDDVSLRLPLAHIHSSGQLTTSRSDARTLVTPGSNKHSASNATRQHQQVGGNIHNFDHLLAISSIINTFQLPNRLNRAAHERKCSKGYRSGEQCLVLETLLLSPRPVPFGNVGHLVSSSSSQDTA